MLRRDGLTLPDSRELSGILDKEAKRDLPLGKERTHYVDFSPFVALLDAVNISSELITRDFEPEEAMSYGLMEHGDRLLTQLIERLSSDSASIHANELLAAYDYLAQEDELAPADLIFVFGAKTPLRAEKAVSLYQAGLASRLVFSGRSPNYQPNVLPEAETYRHFALEHGVPDEAITIETNSITIPDNVRSSLNLLDERGQAYNSMILVNSPYAQRRGWAHFRKYLPDDIKLIRQNCGTAAKFSREEWHRTPDGIKTVANEFIKMKFAVSLNTA